MVPDIVYKFQDLLKGKLCDWGKTKCGTDVGSHMGI
jgi:hypothetical protein